MSDSPQVDDTLVGIVTKPFTFQIGGLYRRRDVYRVIGKPEDTKGGNWDTGYARLGEDWFIFCNVNAPGRTGHNYANRWVGDDLLWEGKTGSSLHHPSIRSMIRSGVFVYIFVRTNNGSPFTFVGWGRAKSVLDTTPVTILWELTSMFGEPLIRATGDAANEMLPRAALVENQLTSVGAFTPRDLADARERVMASIVRRRGQSAFRNALLLAYGGRCAISEENTPDVLEAAHILPYRGPQTDVLTNGLLLRSDLHTLFDLGRIAIESTSMTLVISPSLERTGYAPLSGQQVLVPRDPSLRPSRDALDEHRVLARL